MTLVKSQLNLSEYYKDKIEIVKLLLKMAKTNTRLYGDTATQTKHFIPFISCANSKLYRDEC